MEVKSFFAQDSQGNIIPGATCTVFIAGTAAPAVDLIDRDGAALTNPFQAGDNGEIEFGAPDGDYDIRVTSAGKQQIIRAQFNDVGTTVKYQELAAPGGAGLVGNGGIVFDSIADMQAATWLAIGHKVRNLGYYTPGDGGGNDYEIVAAATGTDDGGSFINLIGSGLQAKGLFVDGLITFERFGAVGNNINLDSAAISNAIDFTKAGETVSSVGGKEYYIGPIAGDTVFKSITKNIKIDFNGSKIRVSGDNSSGFTSTTFIQFKDSPGSMRNYIFEDDGYSPAGPSRGVIPVSIHNDLANTSGYELGPFNIIKGQSLLTASSSSPNTARASNIKLLGSCQGGSVYYGVNLANNGDELSGHYSLNNFKRAVFLYGVRGCDVSYFAKEGDASSANLLVSNSGSGFPKTENIKIRAHHSILNGLIAISEQPSSGNGSILNTDLDVVVESLGGNLSASSPIIAIGAYNNSGGFLTSATTSIDKIKVNIKTELVLTSPVTVPTSSPNYGVIDFYGLNVPIGEFNGFHVKFGGNLISKGIKGDTTVNTLSIGTKYFVLSPSGPGLVRLKVDITTQQDSQFAVGSCTIASYDVIGYVSSGNLVLQSVSEKTKTSVGTIPTISITSSGLNLIISVSGYSSSTSGLIHAAITIAM